MKPSKNRVYCYGSHRTKMLFESKAKADNFIAYNSKGILEENGKAPIRSYYCRLCGGYHVTSNPSVISGETLDQRDQELLKLANNYNKGEEEFKQKHGKILEDINKAKKQIYLGNFEDIAKLYNEFQVNQKFLLGLSLKIRTKYIQLRQKIEILKNIADQLSELSLEEIKTKLETEDLSKDAQKIMNGYFILQRCAKNIERINELMVEKRWEEAQSLIPKFREEMPNMKGVEIVSSCITQYRKELANLEIIISSSKKKEKERNQAVSDEEYKQTILSIIDHIEKAKQFLEHGDQDNSESQLEIAEFLLSDFMAEDDNTKLLRSQIEEWKKKLESTL
jgi:hypothetical protein